MHMELFVIKEANKNQAASLNILTVLINDIINACAVRNYELVCRTELVRYDACMARCSAAGRPDYLSISAYMSASSSTNCLDWRVDSQRKSRVRYLLSVCVTCSHKAWSIMNCVCTYIWKECILTWNPNSVSAYVDTRQDPGRVVEETRCHGYSSSCNGSSGSSSGRKRALLLRCLRTNGGRVVYDRLISSLVVIWRHDLWEGQQSHKEQQQLQQLQQHPSDRSSGNSFGDGTITAAEAAAAGTRDSNCGGCIPRQQWRWQ